MTNHQRALAAEHRPRELQGEPRLCIADEREIAEAARRSHTEAAQVEVAAALARMAADLELVRTRIGVAAPGDHRGYLRSARHALKGLQRVVDS
jgi:hypothetical protein